MNESLRREAAAPMPSLNLVPGAVSLAVVLPPETFAGAIFINAVGITAAVALLAFDWTRRKQGKTAEVVATPY